MRRLLAYAGLWASVPVIAFAVVYVGLTLASVVGASAVWTGSTSITSPFYTAWTHHQYCGKPTSGVKRGYYGNYRQTFAHCSMTFSTVYVTRLGTPTATPRPTRTPLPPVPSATPVPTTPAPAPRATQSVPTPFATQSAPTPQPPSDPTPLPIPTAISPSDPIAYELSLMNTTRAQYGLPPYSINPDESTCSLGHSEHMASVGYISHDQFPSDICVAVRTAGENVGMAGGYSVNGALDVIHQEMMAEPHSVGCTGNHACSIISPTFTSVGIGVYTANGSTWLTVDFLG